MWVAITLVSIYLFLVLTAWVGTRNYHRANGLTPGLSDAICVIVPIINLFVSLYYAQFITSTIDTSRFFGLNKKKERL
jgi:hypothetical protein